MKPEASSSPKFRSEIESFKDLWKGGYYEGNPLEPMGYSSFGYLGYMSVLHAAYIACIKPYITEQSIVLEIGPGRGAWTKTLLKAKEIWCLDALSAEHNDFWNYVGHNEHVKYFQVSDLSCDILPDNKFDYLFSFGCFCHISFEGMTEYMKNLYSKLQQGAHCFVMNADYDKYNACIDNIETLSYWRLFPRKLRWIEKIYSKFSPSMNNLTKLNKNEDNSSIYPGRWYHHGIENTCEMLENLGYKVLDPDMQVNHRDPVVHFTKI